MEAARLAATGRNASSPGAYLSPHSGKSAPDSPANAGQRLAGNSPEQTMVTEYHGKEPLTKTKKAQRQVATPAATDVWVNDGQGVPLLVVTLPMNEHLTLVLEPIVAEVQTLMGPQRRFTVLFDRGGFSAKLFRACWRWASISSPTVGASGGRCPEAVFRSSMWTWTDGAGPTRFMINCVSGSAACVRREAPAAGRWTGVFVDAANHGAARRWPANGDLDESDGFDRCRGGVSFVPALAAGELLQVHDGGVCPGRFGRVHCGRAPG